MRAPSPTGRTIYCDQSETRIPVGVEASAGCANFRDGTHCTMEHAPIYLLFSMSSVTLWYISFLCD
jgi:hypothetical protein